MMQKGFFEYEEFSNYLGRRGGVLEVAVGGFDEQKDLWHNCTGMETLRPYGNIGYGQETRLVEEPEAHVFVRFLFLC